GFRKGAPIILVSGCHIGDCHYIDANHWTEKRIERVRKKMAKLGIRSERLQLEWISAAEGVRFAEVMQCMESLRQTVTPEEIDVTVRILNEKKEGNP
ncbi:hydrogenase iron-sulfur subunit, partial [Thermodesulfobacteriota bacterium]